MLSSGFLTKLNGLFGYVENGKDGFFYSSSGFLSSGFVTKGLPPGAENEPNDLEGEVVFLNPKLIVAGFYTLSVDFFANKSAPAPKTGPDSLESFFNAFPKFPNESFFLN